MFANLSSIPITTHVASPTLSLSYSGKYDPEKINPQTCIERIRKVLETLKQGISNGNVNLKKITCPILADTPRNPVVTNCGHIYEEAVLAQWRTGKEITPCTICREPITTAFPIHDLRALIEDWQKEEPILTLSQFKANNQKRAANYLKIAKSCSDEQETLGLYAMAFWFTNRSEDYAAVPKFYQQLKQPAKAALAYLHLALYQLQEDKVEEAIQTLKYCKQISPELLKIDGIIIGLQLMGTQPITSVLIAHNLWDWIENWHKIESFPTLSHFKEDNKRRADLHLDVAKEYNISDEKETLDAYRKAFFYTNRSEDYAAVPEFYQQLEQPKKAALAYLHLALYQLREDKVQEAIISLAYCKQINPELLKIDEFINLCLALNFRHEQMNEALSIASTQTDPEEAIYIYKQIIAHNPCLFEAYKALLPLLKDSEERKHLLLKAASHADKEGKVELAANLLQEAKLLIRPPSISLEDWANPIALLEKIGPYPKKLEDFLTAPCPIYGHLGKTASETHIVAPLFKNISFNDTSGLELRSLNTLDKLDKASGGTGIEKNNEDSISTSYVEQSPTPEFEWAVFTKDLLPESKNKDFQFQMTLVESKGYQVPGYLDAATCILWQKRYSGEILYKDRSYTRCREQLLSGDGFWTVGGFTPGGLEVTPNYFALVAHVGIAGLRKFALD